jgi:PEP-CTERM motif
LKLSRFLCVAGFLVSSSAFAATSFPQCPAVGNDTSGCEFLITVTAASGGSATAFSVAVSSPDLGAYDGSDDTLVGVLNSSGAPLSSLSLSSPEDIFAFDGDGACSGGFGAITGCSGGVLDPSGYAPLGVTFSNVNSAFTSGTVNFGPSLASGGSTWFSLEEALTLSDILPGNSSAPEPSSMWLLALGLCGSGIGLVRKRKSL